MRLNYPLFVALSIPPALVAYIWFGIPGPAEEDRRYMDNWRAARPVVAAVGYTLRDEIDPAQSAGRDGLYAPCPSFHAKSIVETTKGAVTVCTPGNGAPYIKRAP